MKKLMQKSIAAAAANNTHTHPLKGGGVVFAACSTREGEGHTPNDIVRESRNPCEAQPTLDAAERESRADEPTPRISPETPLTRVETSGEGQDSGQHEIITSRAGIAGDASRREKA